MQINFFVGVVDWINLSKRKSTSCGKSTRKKRHFENPDCAGIQFRLERYHKSQREKESGCYRGRNRMEGGWKSRQKAVSWAVGLHSFILPISPPNRTNFCYSPTTIRHGWVRIMKHSLAWLKSIWRVTTSTMQGSKWYGDFSAKYKRHGTGLASGAQSWNSALIILNRSHRSFCHSIEGVSTS